MLNNLLKNYKSVLCLNGNIPPKSFFNNINLPVIAADGAGDLLINMGIKPLVVIGDLDSTYIKTCQGIQTICIDNQNKNDFQKSLEFIKQNNFFPTLVTGVDGGFIDHVINNLDIIIKNNCNFYSPPILGYVIKAPNVCKLELSVGTKISLFGIPGATVTTHGLKWEIQNKILKFPGHNSALNRTNTSNIYIEIKKGCLLLLVYTSDINDKGLQCKTNLF